MLLAQLLEAPRPAAGPPASPAIEGPDAARAKPAWVWPALGAAATLFPDIDGVTILGGPDLFKAHHQLYTHNVIAFAVAPPLVALLAHRLTRRRFAYPRLLALFWIGMAFHLAGDLIAQWPLKFLYPFSTQGWSFGFLPRDFSIGLAIILMFAALLGYVDQVAPYRRFTAATGLVAGVLYATVGPGW